ncbi:PIG-L family deacetylase [Starkeya koreensis]|uniref:PIG-L family deacetylase n=1 Tax=Ancylobacter koreensis TaxID=266121 RepID=A0ABT0DKX9_9HYPH|nr:PIG-L family deacetylase [Ancylobacter koreensis]MCK0207952.1 PIG-L family deacetylase [Ancylobacter koreensis]
MTQSVAQALAAMARFPLVEPANFVRRGLAVVAPHPDDESLGCGGLIAACRAAGLPVSVIIVSGGAGSHPNSRLHAAPRLAELRRREALEATARLGVPGGAVHFLELPDRFVPSDGPVADRAARRIAELAAGADVVAVTWRHDPHADHKASFALARMAMRELPQARLWEYPIWGLTLPPEEVLDGPPAEGVKVAVGPFLAAKRAAIAAHASQTTDLVSDDLQGFRLAPGVLALFEEPAETFIGPAS